VWNNLSGSLIVRLNRVCGKARISQMKYLVRHITRATFIAAFLCLPIAAQQPQTFTGQVVGVSDGGTITVLDVSTRQRKIRFNGIDAPELGQAFGSRSKQSLSDLVLNQVVTETGSKIDRYGRLVGKVRLGGRDIGLLQIERGLAWFFRQYAHELSREDARAYERAEMNARSERRGLWVDPAPVPPWEYRAQQRGPVPDVPPVTSGVIIGNRNSRVYHRPDCPDYAKVSERNRVYFKTVEEAERAGYRVAGNCPRVF
jgi:endonuclease YncB( thermonuclease family)